MDKWFAIAVTSSDDTESVVRAWSLPSGVREKPRVLRMLDTVVVLGDENCEAELQSLPGVVHLAKPGRSSAPELADGRWYVNLLTAWEHVVEYSAAYEGAVVNMSLGPIDDCNVFDANEPLNRATRLASSRGVVVVAAAGNDGRRGDDTMTRWAKAPWVISVGAADRRGRQIEPYSSRGIAGDATIHPTVVAPGTSMLTGDPGTSFAAQQITDIAVFLQSFALSVWKTVSRRFIPYDEIKLIVPRFVRNALEEFAAPMNAARHECGAGFVDIKRTTKFLKTVDVHRLSALLPIKEALEVPAVSSVRKKLRNLLDSAGHHRLLRIAVDTTFEWSRPTFVPGLIRMRTGYLLCWPSPVTYGDDFDRAETSRDKASWLNVSILPRRRRGRTLSVGPGGAFETIGAALEEAREWDTIHVRPGVYNEEVVLKSGIDIVGDDRAIVRHATRRPVLLNKVRDVSLTNLDIVSLGEMESVGIFNSHNIVLEQCRIGGAKNGVNAFLANRIEMRNCKVDGGTNAGYFAFCRNVRLRSGSYFLGGNSGLLLYASSASITGCAITGTTVDGIIYIPSNSPWTRQWIVTIFRQNMETFRLLALSVGPSQVSRRDVTGEVARLTYGLLLRDTQLIGGHAALAATSFESIEYEAAYIEAGWTPFARIRGNTALPTRVHGLSYVDAQAAIARSLYPVKYTPTVPPS